MYARAFCAALLAGAALSTITIRSASAQGATEIPVLVVTATRSPLALARAGSAITVIDAAEIAARGSKSVADVLRGVPGLDITEQGGPGGLSTVALRGTAASQTLVLVDGFRVGDTTSTGGETDLGAFSLTDVERIEVLRGPQSALYGSDAMGGVINIITSKGTQTPRRTLTLEGGSYGTLSLRAGISGATERLSYAFSVSGLHTDGFSRWGYRIARLSTGAKLESDRADKGAASARIAYRVSDDVEVEAGLNIHANRSKFDNAGSFFITDRDDRLVQGRQLVTEEHARISVDTFGGMLRNSLTVFHSSTERNLLLSAPTFACVDAFFNSFDCKQKYLGQRVGAEYQGNLKLGALGLTIFGLRTELETARTSEELIAPPTPERTLINARQTTNSAFLLHQASIGERLDVSLGARIDSVDSRHNFATWRATAAYRIEETGTKLRASIGTGAKSPSLYQRFSIYGDPALRAEQSFGIDAGIDQMLLDGRVKLSATVFDTRYRDLIDFDFAKNNFVGGYYNVGRAHMSGVELSGDAVVVPDMWRVRATYTYLDARDITKNQVLLRRPQNKGSIGIIYSGVPNLEVEGRAILVGRRIDSENDFPYGRVVMPAYVRFDARAEYKINETVSVYARAENIGNARYEEVRDYGTAGRSFFGGVKFTW